MSDIKWFSARLRFAILVEPNGADTLNECLFLIKAEDFASAFERAISIGESQQEKYFNVDNKRVVWKFMDIVTLDIVAAENLDGAEIYSEPVHLNQENIIPFNATFVPAASKPIQTI